MPKYKDEPPAVRVYTVCDESKYLIVRNVPSLGCGDELLKLFSTYGQVEECKPMDAEECEPYTDVYWIKFHLVSNARFAKRKLDESVFLGNRLQVSYAPEYESLSDTKEKLEGRRKEVLARLNPRRSKGPSESVSEPFSVSTPLLKHAFTPTPTVAQSQINESQAAPGGHKSSMLSASSDKLIYVMDLIIQLCSSHCKDIDIAPLSSRYPVAFKVMNKKDVAGDTAASCPKWDFI
ncbi:RNA-binding protein 48 [Sesamum angolense]|uniref:RNA-binding protein 48 n=1 Tax=Sesamum angolense TaxID=2727404 RepID=A0AAE1WUK3_9LAMI|nr:RNA-binding protein 48 [Sesamum angolense]